MIGGRSLALTQKPTDLVEAACQRVAVRRPELQRTLGETSSQSASSIRGESSGFLGAVWNDRTTIANGASAKLSPLIEIFDVALIQVCDLAVFGHAQRSNRSPIIWPNAKFPRRPSRNAVFYVLAANLAQTIQAVRLLIVQGFENQARSALRNFVELADLTLAVLADEGLYGAYIETFVDEKATYTHWSKRLRPSIIQKLVLDLERADPISTSTDATPEQIRREFYGWLSQFTHNNFAAHVVAAHPVDADGNHGALAMLGEVGEMSRATLAHGLMYLWVTLTRLQRLLWSDHGWGGFRGGRTRKWFEYRFLVFDGMCAAYLPTFWDEGQARP